MTLLVRSIRLWLGGPSPASSKPSAAKLRPAFCPQLEPISLLPPPLPTDVLYCLCSNADLQPGQLQSYSDFEAVLLYLHPLQDLRDRHVVRDEHGEDEPTCWVVHRWDL